MEAIRKLLLVVNGVEKYLSYTNKPKRQTKTKTECISFVWYIIYVKANCIGKRMTDYKLTVLGGEITSDFFFLSYTLLFFLVCCSGPNPYSYHILSSDYTMLSSLYICSHLTSSFSRWFYPVNRDLVTCRNGTKVFLMPRKLPDCLFWK